MISDALKQVLARARARGVETHLDRHGRIVVHDRRRVHDVQSVARELDYDGPLYFASGDSGESGESGGSDSGTSSTGTAGTAYSA